MSSLICSFNAKCLSLSLSLLLLLLLQLCHLVAVAHPDRITHLPGQPHVKFHHFSGYVSLDEKNQRALFYYFVEAESDELSKPLVLWLNGGPGCSSIGVGAFSENGPFRPKGEGLVRNKFSWNKGTLYCCLGPAEPLALIPLVRPECDKGASNHQGVPLLLGYGKSGKQQKQTYCTWKLQLELDSLTLLILPLMMVSMTRLQASI
ncbi:hypothetical protein Lal_00036806 [Lupinus albus]|nr:hypothetical protein Lal_00036806 [Lupinus albus]